MSSAYQECCHHCDLVPMHNTDARCVLKCHSLRLCFSHSCICAQKWVASKSSWRYICIIGLDANCMAVLMCREFRPILRDCYSQDTSQSSRLFFELKRSEAQNLCRAFNGAAARVNLGSEVSRPAASAVQGSKGTSSSNAQESSATVDVSLHQHHLSLQLQQTHTWQLDVRLNIC